jgi:hypothetical protein
MYRTSEQRYLALTASELEVLMTVDPAPFGLVFTDGFESGGTAGWCQVRS